MRKQLLLVDLIQDKNTRFDRNLSKGKIADEQPLRSELFSRDQFELHAKFLAEKHAVSFQKCREKLLMRLTANEEALRRANALFTEAVKAKQGITPAAEWLLDNFHLIEEQIHLAQKFLPVGYSRELPSLSKGPMTGYPRIYDIAMEMVSHGDGRLDIVGLKAFITAYQKIKDLNLGELWGIPIMLRLALIENLRRVSVSMIMMQMDRNKADYWANGILCVASGDTNRYIRAIADMAKEDPVLSDSFVSEFMRRLQGQSTNIDLPVTWIERKLAEQGETIDRYIRSTNRKQAANQVSIANTIESLRVLDATDWHDFVETLSVVDEVLRRDPSETYQGMDFATRDRYRHSIEKIAMKEGLSEKELSLRTVALASENAEKFGAAAPASHVGYYLIDKGLKTLFRSFNLKLPLDLRLQAKETWLSLLTYAFSISVFTGTLTALSLSIARSFGLAGWQNCFLFAVPLLFVSTQTAIAVVNWASTLLVTPKNLPSMDYKRNIPAQSQTLVVTPTLLGSPEGIDSLIDNLEVCYLSNMDTNVCFALLTDFRDAKKESLPEDEALLSRAVEGIERLNAKYPRANGDVFFLFHRNRKWNERERLWMGYERKRGKLSELNAVLRGSGEEKFSLITGSVAHLRNTRYVITLDTDTRMPRDAVKDLTSIAAHPLNRPIFDKKRRRVVSGYGILQPRVEASYPDSNPSTYVKLFGGEIGIDPYTKAVSDVYQDLFFEGSFIGKGLYDIDAFEYCLKDRLPENLILSHDMLEGCYIRSALVSEVELHEKYPTSYLKDVSRRRRWIRGDWQILQWLLPRVPAFQSGAGPSGKKAPRRAKERNPLSLLSRWKILDNLRRSFVPASSLALFVLGWISFADSWPWTFLVLSIALFPLPLKLVYELVRKPEGISFQSHITGVISSFLAQCARFSVSLSFLPYEAWFSLVAVIKTLWRMGITRRHLLEWNAFAEVERGHKDSLPAHLWNMLPALLFVLPCAVSGFARSDRVAVFLFSLWGISPAIGFFISRRPLSRRKVLPETKTRFLGRLARRTWGFFEEYVTDGDNFLPPDNFQEEPLGVAAHRTSPTNIGLSLLSNLTAYDFGYISMGRLLVRTEKTLNTMDKMERFRGHFYNWYDTETLAPLNPLYVSSVDSGNLTGHLLVLRSGLAELRGGRIVSNRIFEGLADTLDILNESVKGHPHTPSAWMESLGTIARWPSDSLSGIYAGLCRIALQCEATPPIHPWEKAFTLQCGDLLEDLTYMAPWLLLLPEDREPGDALGEGMTDEGQALTEVLAQLDGIPTLDELARIESRLCPLIDTLAERPDNRSEIKERIVRLRDALVTAGTRASERILDLENAMIRCGELSVVEYKFLYDRERRLFSIGYNVAEQRADASCYDLLASESRLASFVAIAQGSVPQEHWFMLGRLLSMRGGDPLLVSWGGSMFEYLMPLLVMPDYEGTLLNRTYKSLVKRQIEYGKRNDVPWGVSESGYNKMDASLAYQYRSFGVPDTGFKRGLSEDLVVAPYASVMALMVDPERTCANLERLYSSGFAGEYGFFEAIDYTPSRLAVNEDYALVKSYMAHHQGMSFLSLSYHLLNRPMQRRFLLEPMFKATVLLLQERVPAEIPYIFNEEASGPLGKVEERVSFLRVFTTANTPAPEIHLLSNGKYSVMVTNAGTGYSRWKNLALTRWKEDSALDGAGTFIYLRDLATGDFWSTAYQPTLIKPRKYEVVFSQSRAEFKRTDYNIDTNMEVVVSPEDDAELRRITVFNRSRENRTIELTSYAEAVLNTPAADAAHTTFSNLFVQTEIIRPYQAIVCSRRPRSGDDNFPLILHLVAVHGRPSSAVTYETDRSKFIGRSRTLRDPAAMHADVLSDSEGAVLDPVMSLRCSIDLEPQESAVIYYVTAVCNDRDDIQRLLEKFRDRNLSDRVFNLAWTHAGLTLQQINATEDSAQMYGRLAGSIVFANPAWRAAASILKKNMRGQSDLWGFSISGDLPIVLARIEDQEHIGLIAELVQAHTYWRMKGLRADLVIWNEDYSVYRDNLTEKIQDLISKHSARMANLPGGVFLRRADQMSEEDKVLIQAAARIIITGKGGTLSEQLDRISLPRMQRPALALNKWADPDYEDNGIPERRDLEFFNGFGGFTPDGREYVINTSADRPTPAPWANVLANKDFGTVVTESGGSYTWSENAHEFRLTPWKNDPVTDASGEALYVRDEELGRFWSPTPLPAGDTKNYVSRHGFGYSTFEHSANGIGTELTMFVSLEHSIKFAILKVRNHSGRRRSLSVVSYNELVMGSQRDGNFMHIVSEVDPKSGALLAYNHYNKEFPERVVFLDTSEGTRFVCGDRGEFIGRNGTMKNPSVMKKDRLSGITGAGFDPCTAIQVKFELEAGDEKEVTFSFGSGKNIEEARAILQRFSAVTLIYHELERVWEYWKRRLGVVYVETPDNSVNFLVNGWLQYQVLSCRLWGRSGYYQSGGAYGFRDQLQDIMSLMNSCPELVREQLLAFAAHQFVEGDVQHWWHPPVGRGVRTRCSDDYLWLPLVTCRYVREIGDTGILDERIGYIEGRELQGGEESYYDLPIKSVREGTLYEHCVAAVRRGLHFGEHGLSLIGSGDWNDGMNLVGIEGKGESVWLSFFFYLVLTSMAHIASDRCDSAFSDECRKAAEALSVNIEKHAWDGDWYLRAWFDNGVALGSSANDECRIDSIPQSWAVLSGSQNPERAVRAMSNVDSILVDRKNSLIKLFDPPFDKGEVNPGYIRGYVPGVRENGGQYTHAAVWTVMAFAALKDKKRAWELLETINPIRHSDTEDKCKVYKVEPFVMAADIYSVASNAGRGGWTWYTGSASWMYQLIVNSLLGLRLDVDRLYFEPCLKEEWKSYAIHYRFRETFYHIHFQRCGLGDTVHSLMIDGRPSPELSLLLVDDCIDHAVEVTIG